MLKPKQTDNSIIRESIYTFITGRHFLERFHSPLFRPLSRSVHYPNLKLSMSFAHLVHLECARIQPGHFEVVQHFVGPCIN